MKYKIGDRVKIVGAYSYILGAYGEYGRIRAVDVCDDDVRYHVILDKKVEGNFCYWATEKDLESVLEAINEPEEKEKMDKENMQTWKIVIVSTGDKTTAKLYTLGRVIREVSVTRYYKDDYSTEIAAKEAMRKLFQPPGFTGEAMFVGNTEDYGGFTYGKIYEFINGHCIDDDGDRRPSHGYPMTLENGNWGYGDFIKVVE